MIVETTEWESDLVRLVRLDGLPRSPVFPRGSETSSRYHEVANRQISGVYIHHTAGNALEGAAAPKRIAEYHSAPHTRNELGEVIGGGRGWPGIAYTYVVPARPLVRDERLVVYRCWTDSWVTWHTGSGANQRSVGVVVAGHYSSRHAPNGGGDPEPDATAERALEGLVMDYLLPRHRLSPADVRGHFDAGKPTCPGDYLEAWVRRLRGESVPEWGVPAGRLWTGPLDTVRLRQDALLRLGLDLGPAGVDGVWGMRSRGALEAYQHRRRLLVDGVWGPVSERALRHDLAVLV